MWRKKAAAQISEPESVQILAKRLGVDRRFSPRVLYPPRITALLPAVSFEGQALRLHDVSPGGCCVQDIRSLLGPSVGHEVTLTLNFGDAVLDVRSRIVGSVVHRRHIQFLDLPPARAAQIKQAMSSGVCGAALKCTVQAAGNGPALAAREIWNSLSGESLTIYEDVHQIAQAVFSRQTYSIFRNAWPKRGDGGTAGMDELQRIVLFVANIPDPSRGVSELLHALEELVLEAGR